MNASRLLPILVGLALLPLPSVAGLLDQDDAGSGGDAPAENGGGAPFTSGDGLEVAAGTHRGSLVPPLDVRDDYRFTPTPGSRVLVIIAADGPVLASLEDSTGVFRGHASPGAPQTAIADPPGRWRLSIMPTTDADAAAKTEYEFRIAFEPHDGLLSVAVPLTDAGAFTLSAPQGPFLQVEIFALRALNESAFSILENLQVRDPLGCSTTTSFYWGAGSASKVWTRGALPGDVRVTAPTVPVSGTMTLGSTIESHGGNLVIEYGTTASVATTLIVRAIWDGPPPNLTWLGGTRARFEHLADFRGGGPAAGILGVEVGRGLWSDHLALGASMLMIDSSSGAFLPNPANGYRLTAPGGEVTYPMGITFMPPWEVADGLWRLDFDSAAGADYEKIRFSAASFPFARCA